MSEPFRLGSVQVLEAAAALPYLQRACDGKFGLGCRNLAVLWQRFGSPQKAEEFYERGCDLADAEACEQAGWYWCEGKLAKADDTLAVRYLARACEGGRPWACGHLGIFFEWGQKRTARSRAEHPTL